MSKTTRESAKQTIRALLDSSRGGYSPRQLMQQYKFVTGSQIPYESLGYHTLMAYLSSLTDVLTIIKRRDGTLLKSIPYTPADKTASQTVSKQRHPSSGFGSRSNSVSSNSTTSNPPTPASVSSTNPEVRAGLKKQLRNLMLSYPNGIRLDNLQEAFARRFAFYFSFREYGFNTLTTMVESIPDVLTINYQEGLGIMVKASTEDTDESFGINWAKVERDRKNADKSKEKEGE